MVLILCALCLSRLVEVELALLQVHQNVDILLAYRDILQDRAKDEDINSRARNETSRNEILARTRDLTSTRARDRARDETSARARDQLGLGI